jgi:hypothetical protein
MLPSLSEVTTRPDDPYHGETQTTTLIRPFDVNNHVGPFDIRPKAGESRELEKCKCSETFVSSPARSSTPVLLKNKRQQPHRNPYTEPNVTIVTENICGTQGSKDPQGNIINLGDIKVVVEVMRNRNIDIYLLQETWIYKDIETKIQGITFINHGNGMQKGTNNGGVAILLNKRAQKAWNMAGRPELYKSNTLAGDNTRFLMIELLFNNKKKQSTRIFVASIYAPQSGIMAKDPQALTLHHKNFRRKNSH